MPERKRSRQSARAAVTRARSKTAKLAKAFRADEHGRAVPATVAGYEGAATGGDDRVAEALIARHNARMVNVEAIPEALRAEILSSILPVIQLSAAARALGANPRRHPSSRGNSWIEQLAWGVDSLIAATRLLLCGQIGGAAVVARNQIEVWTQSRSSIAGITPDPGEKDSDFIARAWSQPVDPAKVRNATNLTTVFDSSEEYVDVTDPGLDHKHVRVVGNRDLCPAVVWMLLSEMLHGREYADAAAWDASGLGADQSDEVLHASGLVLDAMKLSIFHIRKLLLVAALDLKMASVADLLRIQMDEFSEADKSDVTESAGQRDKVPMPSELVSPPIDWMAPLLPNEGLSEPVVAELRNAAEAFDAAMNGRRPVGRLYRDDEFLTLAFAWHRYRSATSAQDALDQELEHFADEHDPSALARRATVWIFVTEAAALLGTWLPSGSKRDAACLAASTLRSSWWLWLEDDDRAMAALRCVLEQITRLRVWRRKPEIAEKLETKSTPRDWVENSGWRRLGPLNAALGEFSHLNSRSNWTRAREILTNIQEEPDAREAPYTARRAAAELVTALVAFEVREQINTFSPQVAASLGRLFEEVGATQVDEEKYLNERLNFIWSFRTQRGEPIKKS